MAQRKSSTPSLLTCFVKNSSALETSARDGLRLSARAFSPPLRVVFGFQVGNYIHPKEYGKTKSPVPMDIPRVRYELLTRRLRNSPPVANADTVATAEQSSVMIAVLANDIPGPIDDAGQIRLLLDEGDRCTINSSRTLTRTGTTTRT